MQPDDYTLTPDELSLINSTVEFYQQQANQELNTILRGIVRDGSDVPAGIELLEIDPRGREAQWTGIDERGQRLAQATLVVVEQHVALRAARPTTAAVTPVDVPVKSR